MNDLKSLSVVVPVYNEAKHVCEFLLALKNYLEKIDLSFEIIAVDDGSTDASASVISNLQIPNLKFLQHPSNRGYGAALKTGILKAQYDHIMIIDADGTYPLE